MYTVMETFFSSYVLWVTGRFGDFISKMLNYVRYKGDCETVGGGGGFKVPKAVILGDEKSSGCFGNCEI